MINVAQLLGRVAAYGYAVVVTESGPALKPGDDPAAIPGPLMKALRDNREAIVTYLTACRECGRDMSCPEDRERLKGPNPFCDRGTAQAVTDGNGVAHAASPGCPFRRGNDS